MTNSVGLLVLHHRPPEFWMMVEAVVFHGFSLVHPWDWDVEGEVRPRGEATPNSSSFNR